MAPQYQPAATAAELLGRLAPSTIAAVEESVANAPELPDDTVEVLCRVFAGAGNRILARRQAAAHDAA